MKFKGKPNLHVNINVGIVQMKFDGDGILETNDEVLIKKLKTAFKTIEEETEEVEEEKEEETKEDKDAQDMSRKELFEICKARGIKGYTTMKTEEIRKLLGSD